MDPRQMKTLLLNQFCAINNSIPERTVCHCGLYNREYMHTVWNLRIEISKLYNTHGMIKVLLITRSVLNWSGINTPNDSG
jgi:hypothetical protein